MKRSTRAYELEDKPRPWTDKRPSPAALGERVAQAVPALPAEPPRAQPPVAQVAASQAPSRAGKEPSAREQRMLAAAREERKLRAEAEAKLQQVEADLHRAKFAAKPRPAFENPAAGKRKKPKGRVPRGSVRNTRSSVAKRAKTVQFNVRVSEVLMAQIRAFADRTGLSLNAVGLGAMAHYVGSR